MSGETASAPTPDPRIADAAVKQAELGQQWLDFSKDQFKVSQARQAELDDLVKQVQQKQLQVQDQQLQYAQEDRDRYNTVYKPIEDKFVSEATNYATPERQAEAAAEAKADVQSAAAAARGTSQRQAIGLGINPNSGRFAGIDRAADLGTALATAGAANTARQGVRDKGLALEGQVVNLGKGLPVQAQTETNLGLTSGGAAASLGQANQNLSNSATGIVGAGYQGASNGLGQESAALSNLYGQSLNAYNAQQQTQSNDLAGLFSAIGLGAGLAFKSSKKLKTNKKKVPDGKALEAVNDMPVESWDYKPGVEDGGSHVGPYAEDFKKATGRGDGTSIPVQDAIGVTMKAVQDLSTQVKRIEKAIGLGQGGKAAPKPAAKAAPAPARKTDPNYSDPMPARRPAPGLGIKRAA